MSEQAYDCIVVGAGPAGLSAALFLARYRRRVLVFHHDSPRNLYSHGVHGCLGHHGILPADLLARGREEVTQHGGHILKGCVTRAERTADGHFCVAAGSAQDGGQSGVEPCHARRLLLATGQRDVTPDCPGFRVIYGRSVFHCPDCDGYEMSGKCVAVYGGGKHTVGFTFGMLTWTDRLTLIAPAREERISDEHRARLASANIPVLDRDIERLEGDAETGRLEKVHFTGGDALRCDGLFFNLGTFPASQLHESLGCRLDPECGLVWVDDEQQTSVAGVYAAGDITPRSQLAVVAASEGAMAAIHMHKSLLPAAWQV
jgi:thioredoxin reductase